MFDCCLKAVKKKLNEQIRTLQQHISQQKALYDRDARAYTHQMENKLAEQLKEKDNTMQQELQRARETMDRELQQAREAMLQDMQKAQEAMQRRLDEHLNKTQACDYSLVNWHCPLTK
jgi:membrane peptidoglycan carboxypeptidase